ncbi:MAG: redoxin domain-containing protein [Verrucomicrobiota bacterium]
MHRLLCLFVVPLLAVTSLAAESLQDQLDARRDAFEAGATPEKIALYADGIDSVTNSGIYDDAIKVGDIAPDFALTGADGETVKLSALLEKGPVVLTWYRGGWCPYCNIALAALQGSLGEIQDAGATLVALTPELPDHSLDTAEKAELEFEVLSDIGNAVARDYGIVFKMTDGVAAAMHAFAQTRERNGDDSDELPLSATYMIAPDGEVTYAFLDAEYRNRAEPSRLIDALKVLENGPDARHSLLQFWENTWNPPYDIDLVDRLMSEDFVITTAGTDIVGRENFKDWIRGFQSRIGDLRIKNQDIFLSESGDRVVSRWQVSGHNKGLFETEPDGAEASFTGIAVWEWEDGKLTHNWVERSAHELYQDLTQD